MDHLSRLPLALIVVASLVWMTRAPAASARTGPGHESHGGSWAAVYANAPRTLVAITRAGTYVVMVGAFSPGWDTADASDNNAARFTVR